MDGSSKRVGIHRRSISVSCPEHHDLARRVCCEPSIPCTISPIGLCIGRSCLQGIFESGYIEFCFPARNPICRISKYLPDQRYDAWFDDLLLEILSSLLVEDGSVS